MSRIFKIDPYPYDADEKIYVKNEVTFEPGLTVLVGCNGSGKTTLIRAMHEQLKRNKIPALYFDNLHEGGATARGAAFFRGDYEWGATSFCSSEGENILLNMGQYARKIGTLCRNTPAGQEVWLFFDAVDSGLSVDGVVELKEDLFSFVMEMNSDKDVYIVIAANEYELVRGERCLDVARLEPVEFSDYEAYRKFILASRKKKEARYKRVAKKRQKT